MHIQPQSVNIIYTYKCNAACAHCCFSCSPTNTEKLDTTTVKKIIDQAKEIPSITDIALSGGEIFLFYDEIIEIIYHARLNNFRVSCNTNGYWGEDRSYAEKVMRKLRALSISLLSISYDNFHKEFISTKAIKTIIELSQIYDININLKGTILNNVPSIFELMSDFGNAVVEVPVIANTCMSIGRASLTQKREDFVRKRLTNFRCGSIGRDITIYPDGQILPCCSPAMSPHYISLGNINDTSLSQLISNASGNPSIRHIVKYGVPKPRNEQDLNKIALCESCINYLRGDQVNEE